jgi:hypothetical protein
MRCSVTCGPMHHMIGKTRSGQMNCTGEQQAALLLALSGLEGAVVNQAAAAAQEGRRTWDPWENG